MPIGDPNFNLKNQEAWFAPIAPVISAFANKRNLFIVKYYHDSPSWTLRFAHPSGGTASISVSNYEESFAHIGSVWHYDDYDNFKRYLHWRKAMVVPKIPETISEELQREFDALLQVKYGDWNQVAEGYERIWSRYSKEQFEALGPHYPKPSI